MLKATLLGLIQGLTEFLPISSSGHLVFLQNFLSTDLNTAFDIFVHTGTLFATFVYFWSRITSLSKTYLKNILLSSIPAGFIGIFFKTQALSLFNTSYVVTFGFLVTTILLAVSKKQGENSRVSTKNALIIGLAQAFAIIPGISRSGATITTALNLDIKQNEAFTFSFLLSLPSILGASLLNLTDITLHPEKFPLYLAGFFAAALSGYLALHLLEKIMQKAHLKNFAYYTGALAILTLILS